MAREESVPLIDLNLMSKQLYEAWGPEASKRAFAPNDNTHHDNYGSYELAKCVVEGIKSAKLEIAKHLVAGLLTFDPSRPDSFEAFAVPASPSAIAARPLGN